MASFRNDGFQAADVSTFYTSRCPSLPIGTPVRSLPKCSGDPQRTTGRLNEIACQNVLTAEPAALLALVKLRSNDTGDALLHLPTSLKLNGDEAFLRELLEAGRGLPLAPSQGISAWQSAACL